MGVKSNQCPAVSKVVSNLHLYMRKQDQVVDFFFYINVKNKQAKMVFHPA